MQEWFGCDTSSVTIVYQVALAVWMGTHKCFSICFFFHKLAGSSYELLSEATMLQSRVQTSSCFPVGPFLQTTTPLRSGVQCNSFILRLDRTPTAASENYFVLLLWLMLQCVSFRHHWFGFGSNTGETEREREREREREGMESFFSVCKITLGPEQDLVRSGCLSMR